MNMNVKADKEMHETMSFFNSRPDALTAIVKSRTDIKGRLGDLHLTGIEDDYVDLVYYPPGNGEKRTELRLPFEPPLKNMWAARPRLKAWRDAAYEKWNMPANPPVDYFKLPPAFPYTVPALVLLALLFFALYAPGAAADWLRDIVARNCGEGFIKWSARFAAAMHFVIEPIFMLAMTHKYSTPLVPRIKWVLTNVVVGYGALEEFRECTIYERLRIIYRHTDVGDIGPYCEGARAAELKAKKSE